MNWDESESLGSSSHRWQVWILVACAVLALGTGIAGFLLNGDKPLTAVYQTIQMFFLESLEVGEPVPPLLQLARWLAAASVLSAVLKVGWTLFRRERMSLRLHRMREHTIVCGLGYKSMRLIEYLRAADEEVVVIDKAPLTGLVQDCRRARAHILTGDATDRDTLRVAGAERARQVFALCPEDSVNCEIAAQVRRVRTETNAGGMEPLKCHVHLTDVDLRSSLQPVFAKGGGQVTLRFLDLFDLEARRLLHEHLPLDGPGLTKDDSRQSHLIILGFGRMGRALALRAAQLGHFANGKRLRISVIDRQAETQQAALLFRYPGVTDVCELQFHTLQMESPEVRDLLGKWCREQKTVVSVAICFDNEPRALEMALQLQTMLGSCQVPTAIRLARQSGLARLLRERQSAGQDIWLRHVQPFGMYEDCCHPEFLTEGTEDRLARKLHEDFVRRRCEEGRSPQTNPALLGWDDLDEDFRESNRQQAAHIDIKLRAIGCEVAEQTDSRPAVTAFEADEIKLLARMEHARWVAERILAGWTYAPAPKDVTRKTNPYLVPWEKVAPEVQRYDRDFVVLIPSLLAAEGKKVCRREPTASEVG